MMTRSMARNSSSLWKFCDECAKDFEPHQLVEIRPHNNKTSLILCRTCLSRMHEQASGTLKSWGS